VVAAKFDGPPLEFHAHGARVVVYLWDVREDLCVYFGAHGFGEVLRELWVFYLARERGFYAQSCALVEFWRLLLLWVYSCKNEKTYF
jgi:hypothetical protein